VAGKVVAIEGVAGWTAWMPAIAAGGVTGGLSLIIPVAIGAFRLLRGAKKDQPPPFLWPPSYPPIQPPPQTPVSGPPAAPSQSPPQAPATHDMKFVPFATQ